MLVIAQKFILRFVLIGLQLLLCSQTVVASEQLVSADNGHFKIVSLDSRSARVINELSQLIIEQVQPYLNLQQPKFWPRIRVALRPQQHVDFEGDYCIKVASAGLVTLDLKWDQGLPLTTACAALTDAYLQCYTLRNFGPSALEQMSRWPARSLAIAAYLKLRPAESVTLKRRLESDPRITLAQMFEPSENPLIHQAVDWESYALLVWLRQREVSMASLRNLIESGLRGTDLPAQLLSQFPELEDSEQSSGWSLERQNIEIANFEWCEAMSVSETWLQQMASFQQLKQAGFEFHNLRDLWRHRHEPVLQQMLKARIAILKLRVSKVNPAYFNTARSLGVLFEALLSECAQFSFVHALSDYLTTSEDAKLLQRRVIQAME